MLAPPRHRASIAPVAKRIAARALVPPLEPWGWRCTMNEPLSGLLAGWGATILVYIQLDLFLRNC